MNSVFLVLYLGRGEVAPGAGVDERLAVEAVDGVRHPIVQVQDVLNGNVRAAPPRPASC